MEAYWSTWWVFVPLATLTPTVVKAARLMTMVTPTTATPTASTATEVTATPTAATATVDTATVDTATVDTGILTLVGEEE